MDTFSHVPPGFRFHPTDEELVDYYLRKKIAAKRIDLDVIKDVDLYRIEPWDLQELCRIGSEEQNEWYFFSHKDKKYPTGTRTNRATKAGFWKATGRDKAIYLKQSLIGMRKTLVFYKGRAPNGQKSDWIMHEYRLETNENATPQEEGWVVCRVFKKRLAAVRKDGDHDTLCWYDEQVSFIPDFDSPRTMSQPYTSYNINNPHNYSCKQELDHFHNHHHHDAFLQLPQLESPKLPSHNPLIPYSFERSLIQSLNFNQESHPLLQTQHLSPLYRDTTTDQVTDWRVLDKFVASQLSHEDAAAKQGAYDDAPSSSSSLQEMTPSELASMATLSHSSQVDLWN